jgi:hypothetical protein
VQFEDAEKPKLIEASLINPNTPKCNYSVTNMTLKQKKDEPEVLEWTGKEVNLGMGEVVHTHLRFTVEGITHSFWTMNFGTPAIQPMVRVFGSDDLLVTASLADQVTGNEYLYKKVFVIGDHLQIRWRPKNGR